MFSGKEREREELKQRAAAVEAKEAQRLREQAAGDLCSSPGCDQPASVICEGRCCYCYFGDFG